MAKFQIGDRVHMPGVPCVMTVVEISRCDDGNDCEMGGEIFRVTETQGPGFEQALWLHAADYERV